LPETFAPLLFTRFECFKVCCGISLLTENKINYIFFQPRIKILLKNYVQYNPTLEARGGAVVEALCYKPESRGTDSRWCQWNFSLI
jgi:hypothetical protein